jgi:hypothetical protein
MYISVDFERFENHQHGKGELAKLWDWIFSSESQDGQAQNIAFAKKFNFIECQFVLREFASEQISVYRSKITIDRDVDLVNPFEMVLPDWI